MILLDSDHVSVLADMRHSLHEPFVQRLTSVSEPVAVPVVVLEEHLRGWLARLHRVNDPVELVVPRRSLNGCVGRLPTRAGSP